MPPRSGDMFQGNAGMQMTLLKLLDRHNGDEGPCRRGPCTDDNVDLRVHPAHPLPNSSKRNSRFGPRLRTAQRAVHPRLSGFLPGKGYGRGHGAPLPVHLEKDLPHRLEGTRRNTISATSSCPSRGDNTESTQPGRISKLRDLEIPEKRRSHVITRDLFLFACYTGTAYADAVSITRENLFRDDEGSLWLKYRRKKPTTSDVSSCCRKPSR